VTYEDLHISERGKAGDGLDLPQYGWIPGRNLKGIYEELKRRGVLVRYFDTPKLQDCIRITVGTDDEISEFLRELSEILEKEGAQDAKMQRV
jgi:hypothetical protein